MDGFRHVEDDIGPERLPTQPEGSVDLVVLRWDRAYGEMYPVNGQGKPAPPKLIGFATYWISSADQTDPISTTIGSG